MKTYSHLLSTICCLILLCGCTHNNGDIGPLFGKWKVTAIEVDGTEACDYAGNVFWNFQSHTIGITAILPDHERIDGFGNWTLVNNILSLSFPDSDKLPPVQAALPSQCLLEVVTLNTRHAIFRYRSAEGSSLTYFLTKW